MRIVLMPLQIQTHNIGIILNMNDNEIIKAYLSAIGKKGGSVKGSTKARTREQAQRAVNARWERHRQAREAEALNTNKNTSEHSS